MDGSVSQEAPSGFAAGLFAFWARVAAPGRALLAVSGGSDSMALMRLATALAKEGVAEFEVATVDHGLRPGARAEAQMVGEEARAMGLRHAILNWAGEKPASGLQATARAARYRLLINHAWKIGADAIVAAHTADDQAETVLMRLARGAGPRGLAGMAEDIPIAAGPSEPVRLLRPFLHLRRESLRNFLKSAGARFVDDPSNDDRRFERVRARQFLANFESEGFLTVEALLRTASETRASADALDAVENARFAALGGKFSAFGAAESTGNFEAEDVPLFARVIHAVGGDEFPPSTDAARAALTQLRAGGASTLAGALAEEASDGTLIRREPAALFGRAGVPRAPDLMLDPGACVLWDRRFIVENLFGEPALIRPIDPDMAAGLGYGRSAVGAPAFFRKGEIVAVAGESPCFRPLIDERFVRRVNRFQ